MGNSDTKMKPRHNDVHESLKERNDAIYRDYMDGVCVLELADKYSLSCYRIVEILRSDPKYGLTKTRLDWQKNAQAKHTRNKQIYEEFISGASCIKIAEKWGVTSSCVRSIVKKYQKEREGLAKTRLYRQKDVQEKHARNKQIYEDYISGMSYKKIADKWGMTVSGIQAAAKKYQKDLEKDLERTALSAPKNKSLAIDWTEKKRRLITQARAIPNQSLSNLAKQYGLTPKEARQILREAGIIKCPRNDLSDEALWAGIGGSYDDIY